jgi:hypothetical protein
MAEKRGGKELVTFEELTLSNAWQLEALVEVLVAKRVMTKREVLDMLAQLRRSNPRAAAPQDTLTIDPQKADVRIRHGLDVFNSTGLTAQQAKGVLTHRQALVEICERVAHAKTTH